jgi:hypothetical protein
MKQGVVSEIPLLPPGARGGGEGLIQSQAKLSLRLGSRRPKSSKSPLMSCDRSSSPSVKDKNPPRRRAFNCFAEVKAYAKLRSVAITCTPLRSL